MLISCLLFVKRNKDLPDAANTAASELSELIPIRWQPYQWTVCTTTLRLLGDADDAKLLLRPGELCCATLEKRHAIGAMLLRHKKDINAPSVMNCSLEIMIAGAMKEEYIPMEMQTLDYVALPFRHRALSLVEMI